MITLQPLRCPVCRADLLGGTLVQCASCDRVFAPHRDGLAAVVVRREAGGARPWWMFPGPVRFRVAGGKGPDPLWQAARLWVPADAGATRDAMNEGEALTRAQPDPRDVGGPFDVTACARPLEDARSIAQFIVISVEHQRDRIPVLEFDFGEAAELWLLAR